MVSSFMSRARWTAHSQVCSISNTPPRRTVALTLNCRRGALDRSGHQWKRALLERASGVFERGDRRKPEIDEEQVKELYAKIGELAVANSFLERKLKPSTPAHSAGRAAT
jgi:transposase